ncbi:uncharacterized protein LOC125716487 [Brienomyrus brachyistius]|uniref:uncharacterized protein LOC125716487 n=1 Tax=Brienomyrus brachyistius TaxID=42636 RepID=UPI0020B2D126|nr:uncharacterized protein LOC125716487 [Brienomyrus brachyistius]
MSGSRGGPQGGGLHALLSHTSPQLSAKGIPSDASVQASWTWTERTVSMAAALQAGSEALQAELDGIRRGHGPSRWELSSRLRHHSAALLERGVPASMSAVGHCEVGARVVSTGLTVLVQDQRRGHLHVEVGRTDKNGRVAVSLGHDDRRLDGVLPESFQMNCSGHAAAAQLSGRCSGVVAGFPVKTPISRHFSMNGSLATSKPSLLLDALLEGGPGERGELSLAMESTPQLHLRAAVRHSLPPLRLLGVPPRGTLTLSAHSGGRPSVLLTVVLGPCEVMARLGAEPISGTGETGSSWAANWTNHCQALQDVGLPGSLELSGLVLLSPCRSALSSSLHVDGEALSLELGHTCQPSRRFTGGLTHSFSRLRRRGLPTESRLALLVPGGPGKNGTLLLKVGSCQIRASRDLGSGGKSQWVWATESACPLLEGLGLPTQAQFNGSLLMDGCAVEAQLEAQMEGQHASLELHAQCHPGLRIEGVLQHSLPALGSLPQLGRLLVVATAAPMRYDAQLALRLDLCALAVSGGLRRGSRLEGLMLLQNNCTILRELGTPSRLEGSGSLAISKEITDSHLSLAADDRKLQALLTTKAAGTKLDVLAQLNHSMPLLLVAGVPPTTKLSFNSDRGRDSYHKTLSCILGSQQITEDLSIEKTEEGVRLMYCFNHSVGSLKDFGIPKNNSIQAKLGFGEVRSLSVLSQLGAELASLGAELKDTSEGTKVTGSLQHSWPWLEKRGLPKVVEALCSVQGHFPQLQSRVHLSVDGEKLLVSALNVSLSRGRLGLLFSLAAPRELLPGLPHNLGMALTAHHQGSQKQVSADVYCDSTRVRVAGEMAGWGTGGREARAAVLHIGEGGDTPTTPMLQVEAWGRLTDSQLRCSLAVNPKTNSSLAFTAHGHDMSSRKELNIRMQQNMPALQDHLPSQLEAKAQLNHSGVSMQGLAEVRAGSSELRAVGQLALSGPGWSQALELNHSFAQLSSIPRNMAVRMTYKGGNWTGSLQQEVVWGGHMIGVLGEYATPTEHMRGVHQLQVQVSTSFPFLPHECGLDVRLDSSVHRQLDSVLLECTGQERNEKVRLLCSWSREEELWEGTVDMRQPFTQALSHLHLHTLSQSLAHRQGSSHQAQVSWNEGRPLNATLTVSRHLHGSSSRGQACLLLSPGQMQAVLPLVDIEGCVSMAREGSSYSQAAELKWADKRITQAMKYQRGAKGVHTLQLEGGAENVSPLPCSSHTFLAQVHTNGQDQLEHHLLLGLCPPHPAWTVSGYHRISTGRQLLYTQTRLSVSGQPWHSSLTLVLTNDSIPHRNNLSLHTELQLGDGALELGGSVFSSRRGAGLLMQARLDRSDRLWLQGALEGRCLQTAAGFSDGASLDDELTIALCLEGRRRSTLEVHRREGVAKRSRLASFSVRAANQSLTIGVQGCAESLQEAEARVRVLGSHIKNKLLEKIRILQRLLVEFRHQSRDSVLLQEMSERPLRVTQRAEALLMQGPGGVWGAWRRGLLRHSLTDAVPRYLGMLNRASLQIQQELKRPLATLAGAYQDVTGRRFDTAWRDGAALWARRLVEVLPAVLEEHHQRATKAVLSTLTSILDIASQQTALWVESRLAAALAGLRRQLASLYKLSHSHCEVTLQVPLPRVTWSDVGEAGLVEFLLEEWLLRPVVALTSLQPTAELYRLKRKMIESPFGHQALLVSDQFAVSFNGRLYELPPRCALLLARDAARGAFTVLLSPNGGPQRSLLLEMSNVTVSIPSSGQVHINCRVTDKSITDNGVTVRRDSNLVEVSNQEGAVVSCDLSHGVCSLTLNSWHHGTSVGLLGTNDNEAGNDLTLPDGSQAESEEQFIQSWQVRPQCRSDPGKMGSCSNTTNAKLAPSLPGCASLFSSSDSPLSACFRVVDPLQFLAVCDRSRCNQDRAPCRLAAAFVHLCHRNYVPLELPEECVNT